MTATVMILTAVVCLVAAFAGAFIWAQHHPRQLSTAAAAERPRRRPF